MDLSPEEFNSKLVSGWRRFGFFFFRPSCEVCFQCIPIRVPIDTFRPSRSQRRIMRRNRDTRVIFRRLTYSDEIFEIYRQHSRDRFGQESTKEHFMQSFFIKAVPAMQTEYYVDESLAAVGFLDLADEALSSVYFIYRTEYSHLSPGTFGAVHEIELARSLELKYYYLGYYVADNHSMAYKSRFRPYELYNWQEQRWEGAVAER